MLKLSKLWSSETRKTLSDQRGFTLIEMSIVLAIIGLIVGGVLKGQEVINNARLKTQVAQIDAVKAAVITFQDKYGYLPGDVAAHALFNTSSSADGDQNGGIATLAVTTGTVSPATASIIDTTAETGTEMAFVWLHLSAANLLNGVQLSSGTTLTSATTAYLPGKVTGSYLWLGTLTSDGQTASMVRVQGVKSGAITSAYAFREADAFGLDTKYDDGLPLTGAILANSASSTASCAANTSTDGATAITSTNAYALGSGTATSNYCILNFVVQ